MVSIRAGFFNNIPHVAGVSQMTRQLLSCYAVTPAALSFHSVATANSALHRSRAALRPAYAARSQSCSSLESTRERGRARGGSGLPPHPVHFGDNYAIMSSLARAYSSIIKNS